MGHIYLVMKKGSIENKRQIDETSIGQDELVYLDFSPEIYQNVLQTCNN